MPMAWERSPSPDSIFVASGFASTGRLASWRCLKGRRCVIGAAAGSREGYRLLSEIPVILRRSGRAAFFCMGDAVADSVGVVGKQTGCVM
jgi:hypothetical protein